MLSDWFEGRKMAEADDIRFREVQRPEASVPDALYLAAFAAMLTLIVSRWALRTTWGDVCFLFLAALSTAYMVAIELTTEVRGNGVYTRLRPYQVRLRRIPLERVTGCEVEKWGMWEAWKMRNPPFRRGKVTRYVGRGRSGVGIDYADGSRILIGSQRPDELAEAIRGPLREKGGSQEFDAR